MTRMWNLTIRIGKVLWLSEPYSAGVQLGGGGGGVEGGRPCPYLNIGKNCPNFGKNPDCGHLWVKFLISSAIFKSFLEKEQKKILWDLFCHVVDDCLLMCPKSKKTSLPKKFLVPPLFWLLLLFWKLYDIELTVILKSLASRNLGCNNM